MLSEKQLTDAIERLLRDPPRLPDDVNELEGLSSWKMQGLLNGLCKLFPCCRYVEAGTHHGKTLISAAYHNSGGFHGIDFQDKATRQKQVNIFQDRCGKIVFHHGDSWQILNDMVAERDEGNFHVNVYFYDARHEEYDTGYGFLMGLRLRDPDEPLIIVMDDYNYSMVRRGWETCVTLFPPAKQWKLVQRGVGNPETKKEGFWNGVAIALYV